MIKDTIFASKSRGIFCCAQKRVLKRRRLREGQILASIICLTCRAQRAGSLSPIDARSSACAIRVVSSKAEVWLMLVDEWVTVL